MPHGGEDRATPILAGSQQSLHRHVAQSAGRRVGDPQQTHVVVRIHEGLEVGQEVPDFPPVEKALPADQIILHLLLTQLHLQRPALQVGPEQDGVALPRNPFGQPVEFDLFDHLQGFRLIRLIRVQTDAFTLPLRRPESFAPPLGVVPDNGVGGVQNGVGGAVVLFELHHLHLRKMFFQIQQVRHFRSAPAVNALVIIANHTEIPMNFRQGVDQFELRGIGILIFIHHHETILGPTSRQGILVFAKQLQGQYDQIVKVHRIARLQGGVVFAGDDLGHRHQILVPEPFIATLVLVPADQRKDRPRIPLGILAGGNRAEDFSDGTDLLRLVVNDEILLVPEFLDVLAQDPDTEGVEGANGRLNQFAVFILDLRDELAHPLLHLAGRLVGERHAENIRGRYPPLDHVSDPVGDHPRLAGTGARQNQHGTTNGLDGVTLFRIERPEIDHKGAESRTSPITDKEGLLTAAVKFTDRRLRLFLPLPRSTSPRP